MPRREPNTNNPNTELDKLLGGRDSAGKFLKRTVQVEKMRDAIRKLTAQEAKLLQQIKRSTKSTMKALRVENQLLKGKSRLQGQVQRLTNQLNQQRRSVEKATRSNKLYAGSFGRIVAGVGALGLAYKAFGQIQKIVDARLGTFLNLGAGATQRISQLGGQGIAPTTKFELLSGFVGQGINQFIQGQSEAIQKALLSFQDRLSKTVGATTANQLLLDVTKSFGADVGRRRAFLESVGQQGVEPALQKFLSQSTFVPFTRAINALQQPQDPTLQIRADFLSTIEELKRAFELLVVEVGGDLVGVLKQLTPELKKFLQWVSKLSSKDLAIGAAVGAGGLIAANAAGGAALRGAGKLAAKGIGAAVGAVGSAGAVGIGSAVLAADQFNRFARGKGTIGGSLTDSLFDFDEKQAEINRKGDVELLRALRVTPREFERKQKRLQEQNQQQDAKRLQALRKETKAIDQATKSVDKFADKLKTTPTAEPAKDILGGLILEQAELQLPKELERAISATRREELNLARQGLFGGRLALDELSSLRGSLEDELETARKDLAVQQKILAVAPDKQAEIEAERLRTAIVALQGQMRQTGIAVQQAPLQLRTEETALRRLELTIASLTPFGRIGALKETQQVNKSLRQEIAILNRMAASQELTALETIKVRQSIISRELEIRSNQRAFLSALKDQSLAQVAGATGGGRSIIITQQDNAAIGLRKKLFGLPSELTRPLVGNVDKRIAPRMPMTAMEILGRSPYEQFNSLNRTNIADRANRKPVKSATKGKTSADSMDNMSKLAREIADQLREERQGVENRISEPVTTYAGNRLFSVQPSP